GAAEVALGRAHVFQDLRLERWRRFECALVADAPEKLHAQAARDGRGLFRGRIEQKSLDGKLVARSKSRAVTDVGEGIPLAPGFEMVGAGDVDAARGNHFGGSG